MISIVLATYNGENFIVEQLDSIRLQKVPADEVIICDDCSKDSTFEIIEEYIEKYQLKNWYLYPGEENLGYQKNFFKGLQLAKGDIIFLADQDDIWYEDKIELMSSAIRDNPNIKLLASNVTPLYMGKKAKKVNYEKFIGSGIIKFDFCGRWIKPIRPGCSFAFKRELIDEFNSVWFEGYPHDALLWALAMFNNGAFLLNKETIKFRRHDTNASNCGNKQIDYRKQSIRNEITIAEKMLEYNIEKENQFYVSFIRKQLDIYKGRLEYLESKNILRLFYLIPSIRYYGRPRYWLTDLYYIIKR